MTEDWKVHPVLFEYEVSTLGRIRRAVPGKGTHKGRMKVPTLSTTGYLTVNIAWKPRKVHALVLETFVSLRPEKHDGCHIDGDRTNNALSNLRWATRAENMAGARKHGTLCQGETHGLAKLKATDVTSIRLLALSGVKLKVLAKMYGVTPGHVSEIVSRKTWASI